MMKTTIDKLITHYRIAKREAEKRNNEEYALLLIKNSRENISFQGRSNFGTFMINSVPYNGLLVSQILLDNSFEGELSTLLVVNKRLFTLSSIRAEDIMNLYEI